MRFLFYFHFDLRHDVMILMTNSYTSIIAVMRMKGKKHMLIYTKACIARSIFGNRIQLMPRMIVDSIDLEGKYVLMKIIGVGYFRVTNQQYNNNFGVINICE